MKELVKVCKNGTKVWAEEITCDRCGGAGSSKVWKYTGMTCYKCNGTGKVTIRTMEYTPEHEAELQEKRQKKSEKEHAEWLKQEETRQAEEAKQAEEKKARELAEKAQKAISQYQGEVGQKITVKIVDRHTASYETVYGITNIHIMKDAEGNIYTWKTNNFIGWYDEDDEYIVPDEFLITGTIKDHSEYNGEKQTVLTRCKVKAA